jgi:hypothetical protein
VEDWIALGDECLCNVTIFLTGFCYKEKIISTLHDNCLIYRITMEVLEQLIEVHCSWYNEAFQTINNIINFRCCALIEYQ